METTKRFGAKSFYIVCENDFIRTAFNEHNSFKRYYIYTYVYRVVIVVVE